MCPTFAEILKINITYKQIAAFLFLIAFLAQTYSKGFIIAAYYSNNASYAKNCINKATPKLHCNGKCQMMKKLKQEENKDKQNPDRKSDNKNEVLFFLPTQSAAQLPSALITVAYAPYNTTPVNEIAFGFYQPPRA